MSQARPDPVDGNPDGRATQVNYTHSPGFGDVLSQAGCSLLVSTYQARQLVALGTHDGDVTLDWHRFDQPMGIAVGQQQIAVGTRGQVWTMKDRSQLAARIDPPGRYDRCVLARSSIVTGAIQGHELAWGRTRDGQEDLWLVNTRFSCLVGLDPDHSFVPRWKPPFISGLAPEDRCHLNGLAMHHGQPAFTSLFALTDTAGGWRASRNTTGSVLQVPTGAVVATGLAMPHSPRLHEGSLYVLNSGFGRIERVDLATGGRDVVALMPGFTRGLAFHGHLGFVGLSRIRERHTFGDTPIAQHQDQLKCGVGVVDMRTGRTVATFEFTTGVDEIFDVQVVPDSRCLALGSAPGDGPEIWLVPPS